jgi:hypothetical protein
MGRRPVGGRRGNISTKENNRAMVLNLVLGVAFVAVGVLLMFVGGIFGILVGIIAILMGLVLLLRGYRSRTSTAV